MEVMDIALYGHMGRDAALAENLARHGHRIFAAGEFINPTVEEWARRSGGRMDEVGPLKDVDRIAKWVGGLGAQMAITNFDDTLAAGFRDSLERRIHDGDMDRLLIPTPDKEAAKVEWDKWDLRELVEDVERAEGIEESFNPYGRRISRHEDVEAAVRDLQSKRYEAVIKPRNPTGGKGVQVMGKHFDGYDGAIAYAHEVLDMADQNGVEIQERLDGHEFTLQIFTDGETMVLPPETYDFPFRYDGDTGPGTGGMGAFSMAPGEHLSFVTQEDYDEAIWLVEKLLERMDELGRDYKGIIYPTFFKTSDGKLKIVEINARGGDPEMINILDLAQPDVDMGEVYARIATTELQLDSVRFQNLASAMVYMVDEHYGKKKEQLMKELGHVPGKFNFRMDQQLIEQEDVRVRFSAARRHPLGLKDWYRTTGMSRIVGLSALGKKPWDAQANILRSIEAGFDNPLKYLDFRRDVAAKQYIDQLTLAA